MEHNNATHAPRQERSRATAERLLNATLRILDESGLEEAVIPRIAALAEVAPASVYRRFADKEALLRAAFLHALEQSNLANQRVLEERLIGNSLEETVGRLIGLLFDQYRKHPRLMHALERFVDGNTDQEFVRSAQALIRKNADLLVGLMLKHADEIPHPSPEAALRFALLDASCAIEVFALHPNSLWHAEPAMAAEELTSNLVHSCLAYLKTAPKARGTRTKAAATRQRT
jgi:AcrR family transcriptional regulator